MDSEFSVPSDPRVLHELDLLRKKVEEMEKTMSMLKEENNSLKTELDCVKEENKQLKESTADGDNNEKNELDSIMDYGECIFNPATTKIIHLTQTPPLSPQAAQFYSSTKSTDGAITELQQQLNDSRKAAKRTAEVATKKCKEFRSLCCKLFGWRVDVLDSEKRNVKKCRVHSIFNEEDYLNIEFHRRNCDLKPSKFLESMDAEAVGQLINEGGVPRLLHQLYQHLSAQAQN